jgi:hypothetical protein
MLPAAVANRRNTALIVLLLLVQAKLLLMAQLEIQMMQKSMIAIET